MFGLPNSSFISYYYKLQKYIYKRDNRYKPKGNECNFVITIPKLKPNGTDIIDVVE